MQTFFPVESELSAFDHLDYWWIDDMIDRIEFGAHNKTPREYMRIKALGRTFEDDRTVTIFWKCGLKSTLPSGVKKDRDHPARLAELYNEKMKRQGKKNRKRRSG
ncbi:MAG: hypothetical protein IKS18_01000 [Lachnospiraceae bacterium]|nr:hypothetical protein [Lachnospiraceae bacterium]